MCRLKTAARTIRLACLTQITYDVVLWDLQTVTANTRHGLELLEVLAVDSPRTQVLVVANPDIIEFATDCLKAGAWHYIQALVNPKELWALIGAAVEKQPTLGENKLLETQQLTHKFDNMVGSCDSMQTVYKRIQEAAPASAPTWYDVERSRTRAYCQNPGLGRWQ